MVPIMPMMYSIGVEFLIYISGVAIRGWSGAMVAAVGALGARAAVGDIADACATACTAGGIVAGIMLGLALIAASAAVAAVIGTLLGLIAAYAGGKVDNFIMRTVDLLLSFPSVLVAMMILAYLGKSITNVVLTLVLLEWAYYARTVRGQALVERRREYVEAARSLALPGWRIALKHILPNCLPPLIVVGTLQVARAITLEATLSFLGLGVPITEPSLGLLIANGYQYMLSGQYWISFYPGIALLLALVAINLVGDRLREVLNPRTQR